MTLTVNDLDPFDLLALKAPSQLNSNTKTRATGGGKRLDGRKVERVERVRIKGERDGGISGDVSSRNF